MEYKRGTPKRYYSVEVEWHFNYKWLFKYKTNSPLSSQSILDPVRVHININLTQNLFP